MFLGMAHPLLSVAGHEAAQLNSVSLTSGDGSGVWHAVELGEEHENWAEIVLLRGR